MALDEHKIVDADYTGKDISGLADKPTLTAAQLKARFDSLVKNVVAVKFNALIDAVTSAISGFASKVTGATNGNFAALDADGQPIDSLKKPSDFALKVAGAVNGNFAGLDADGYLTDSGKKAADFAEAAHVLATNNPHSVTAAQVVTGKEISPLCVEFSGMEGNGGYIDFHFESAAVDYTSRIIELISGVLFIPGALSLGTPLAINSGGTGATTAADARTALELGNSATKNVGTGSTQVAAGNHTHTPAQAGILSYIGSVTVPSGQNYVNVTISGLTSSHRAFAMRTGETQTTTGLVPQSTVCSTNNCRVYFSDNGIPTSFGLYIIATL